MLWGYQLGDDSVALPVTELKDATVKVRKFVKDRKPVLTRAPGGDPRVSEPYPDTNSTVNSVAAVCGRLLKKTPSPLRGVLTEFDQFVLSELETDFVPINFSDVLSAEDWINTRKRPGSWKRELKRDLDTVYGDPFRFSKRSMTEIKGHIKQESYPEFKYPRGIFARQNPNKLCFGPLISAIEEMVYSHREFIKHVPVADRPKYIDDMLGNYKKFACSDFSSFEGSFSKEFQEVCELRLFAFCIRNFPPAVREAYWERFQWCYEQKEITMSVGDVIIKVLGLRMSGEMWTSLANGFSNLMLWRYLCKLNGTKCVGVVEGDDGLFGFEEGALIPTQSQFEQLGFSCKIQLVDDLYRASFCGIIFDPSTKTNITDPRPFLSSLGWLPYKYHGFRPSKKKSLMRAKALSFYHQYPGCPIIQEAALFVLRHTSGLDLKWVKEKSGFFNAYEEEEFEPIYQIRSFDGRPIADSARTLMSDYFGIDIGVQIEIEEMFQKLDTLEFSFPEHLLVLLFDLRWLGYALEYTERPDTNAARVNQYFKQWSIKISRGLPALDFGV